MRAESLKGHLDALVLATLGDEPLHGYAVIEALRTRSEGAFDLAEGTVYPVLHRLENAGYLASRWTTAESGRKRRVYSLTKRGERALSSQRATWEQFSVAVGGLLGRRKPA